MTINSTEDPDNVDVILEAISSALGGMRICIPGEVTAYDYKQQRASVQPAVQFKRRNGDDDVLENYIPALIENCPVLHPSSGGYGSAMPVTIGTKGILLFADRGIDEWLLSGQTNSIAVDPRRFDVNDAIFLPAGRSFADPLKMPDPRNESWVQGLDSEASVKITFSPDGKIKIGSPAVELLEQVSQIADQLASTALKTGQSVVATSIGTQPLSNAATLVAISTQASAIKTLVDQLKGS